jgi:putative PIN family toxin of toxin-antitoxin system
MMRAVFDCGVIISAIGWGGNPRHCFNLAYAGDVCLCLTAEIWKEYDERIPAVLARRRKKAAPAPVLEWLLRHALFVEPAPLGKQRCRDAKDERYLACALGADAEAIVTNDRDLLALGKPFGVAVMTPIEFLKLVRGRAGL